MPQPGDTEPYKGGCAMKRLLILASIPILAIGAVACTREKPAEPTTVAIQAVTPAGTDTTVPESGAATPTTETTPGTVVPTAAATSAAMALATTASIASSTPSTAAPLPTNTPGPTSATSAPGTYTVQWGDWLAKIAQQFGVSSQAIISANPGINPNLIYPGQVLNIPGQGASPVVVPTSVGTTPAANPGTYTVQRGDWIYALARRFGVSVPSLLAANPGINPNFVYPGLVLNIPGGSSPGPVPPGPVPPGPGGTYVVRLGDTLFLIAVRFHTTIYAIQIANHLANPNFIYPGQTLILPQ
jgi:LysM repeat protein